MNEQVDPTMVALATMGQLSTFAAVSQAHSFTPSAHPGNVFLTQGETHI